MNFVLRRISILALVLVVLPAAAFAGNSQKAKPRPPFRAPYDVIVSVDRAAKTVIIGHVNSSDKSRTTLKINNLTEIQINGNPGTMADVKPGLKVSVTPGVEEDQAGRLVLSPAPREAKPVK